MKIVKSAILFYLLVIAGLNLVARTTGTPESTAINNMRLVFEIFEKDNGTVPTSWVELEKFFSLEQINEQLLKGSSAYPLQQHYVFASDKIPMLGYQEGNVVLIRTEPFEQVDGDLVRKGRYVISKNENNFQFNWLPEEKVQQMLAKAGVKELPKPEPWPPATNSAAQSNSPPRSSSVEPDVNSSREQKSLFQSPQSANPTNETVTVSPSPKEKSWWPVFIVLGLGVIIFVLLRRRKT